MRCINCNSKESRKLFSAPSILDKNSIYSFFHCQKCTLIQIHPYPQKRKLLKFYSYNNKSENIVNKNPQLSLILRYPLTKVILRKYLNWCCNNRFQFVNNLSRHKLETNNLLDVGCAEGDFLQKFSLDKWKLFGIEVNKSLAKIARKKIKKTLVFSNPIESIKLPKDSFDIVTLWHVLEHLTNPKLVVKKINNLSKKNGLLVIEVPNGDSLNRKLFGSYWQLLIVPEHLHFWTNKSITLLLEDCGYRIVKISYSGIIITSFFSSLANFLRSRGIKSSIALFIALCFFPISLIINIFSFQAKDNMLIIAEPKKR